MLFCHKIHNILRINAVLLQNLVVKIYALFPPIFLSWEIVSANFFAFWMYDHAESSQENWIKFFNRLRPSLKLIHDQISSCVFCDDERMCNVGMNLIYYYIWRKLINVILLCAFFSCQNWSRTTKTVSIWALNDS